MTMLGYDPAHYHTGRAPIEAASQGIALAPDDVVFRMNLVSLKDEAGATVMNEVITIAGPTPDSTKTNTYPNAVREWCINSAAVDPFTSGALHLDTLQVVVLHGFDRDIHQVWIVGDPD